MHMPAMFLTYDISLLLSFYQQLREQSSGHSLESALDVLCLISGSATH